MVADNDENDKPDQFAFFIPLRGEGVPPEKWQMNLVDVYLREPVKNTKMEMYQTLYYRGLDINDVGIDITESYKD